MEGSRRGIHGSQQVEHGRQLLTDPGRDGMKLGEAGLTRAPEGSPKPNAEDRRVGAERRGPDENPSGPKQAGLRQSLDHIARHRVRRRQTRFPNECRHELAPCPNVHLELLEGLDAARDVGVVDRSDGACRLHRRIGRSIDVGGLGSRR